MLQNIYWDSLRLGLTPFRNIYVNFVEMSRLESIQKHVAVISLN